MGMHIQFLKKIGSNFLMGEIYMNYLEEEVLE
jgi:hypothetical protein